MKKSLHVALCTNRCGSPLCPPGPLINRKLFTILMWFVTIIELSLRPDPTVGFRVHCGCGFTYFGSKSSKATRKLKSLLCCSGTISSGIVPEHFYKIAISVFTEGVTLRCFHFKTRLFRPEPSALEPSRQQSTSSHKSLPSHTSACMRGRYGGARHLRPRISVPGRRMRQARGRFPGPHREISLRGHKSALLGRKSAAYQPQVPAEPRDACRWAARALGEAATSTYFLQQTGGRSHRAAAPPPLPRHAALHRAAAQRRRGTCLSCTRRRRPRKGVMASSADSSRSAWRSPAV